MKKIQQLFFPLGILLFVMALVPAKVSAQPVKTFNIFLQWEMTDAEAENLSHYDMVAIGPHAVDANPDIVEILRGKNPDIKVLAYVVSSEVADSYATFPQTDRFGRAYTRLYDEARVLRDESGAALSFWPGNTFMNITRATPPVSGEYWGEELSSWVSEDIMTMNVWDGIFYDSVFQDIAWFNGGNIDLDGDGKREDANTLDSAWREGIQLLLSETTKKIGEDKIVVTNGGDFYAPLTNGRFFENFPEILEGGWSAQMPRYGAILEDHQLQPGASVIHAYANLALGAKDYRAMRYALASSLLYDNGYFGFTNRDLTSQYWFDEYGVELGDSLGRAHNLSRPEDPYPWRDGVWQREFDRGIIIVNATDAVQTITLDQKYYRFKSSQDPMHNNGLLTDKLVLFNRDAAILLRDSFFVVAPQASGNVIRQTDGSGRETKKPFQPYDKNFNGGINLHVADLDNDGLTEILTSPRHGSSHVKIFSTNGKLLTPGFYGFSRDLSGGADVATIDIEGDGKREVVVSAGEGSASTVRIFTKDGKFLRTFFAYDPKFRGGVNIAAADLNGDGIEEIITGTNTGAPHVRVFNANGQPLIGGFLAYNTILGSGVRVAVGDLNDDNILEIVTAPYRKASHVRMFTLNGRPLTPGFFPYGPGYREGVNVSIADLSADQKKELITGTNIEAPLVKFFDFEGQPLRPGLYMLDPQFQGGVEVQLRPEI